MRSFRRADRGRRILHSAAVTAKIDRPAPSIFGIVIFPTEAVHSVGCGKSDRAVQDGREDESHPAIGLQATHRPYQKSVPNTGKYTGISRY